jgi:hypothetical protein
MRLGVHFQGEVPANTTKRWFAPRWPQDWRVLWMIVPTGPVQDTAPQLECQVTVERQATDFLKYWIEVKNLSGSPVTFEARYAVMN